MTLIERLASVPCVGADYRPFSVAPDGASLAVQLYRDGDWQVFLTGPDGETPRRVGDLDDACLCPLFAPDGRLYLGQGRPRFRVLRLLPVRPGDRGPGQPAARDARLLAAARLRPLPGRLDPGHDRLARRRLLRGADAQRALSRRRRPAPPRGLPVHGELAAVVARRRAGRRGRRHARAGHRRLRAGCGRRRFPRRRRRGRLLRRPPVVGAGRAPARLQRRPLRPPGHRRVPPRDARGHLGVGGRVGRAPPRVGAGRREPRLPRRARRGVGPRPAGPQDRRVARPLGRAGQPLPAVVLPGRRVPARRR